MPHPNPGQSPNPMQNIRLLAFDVDGVLTDGKLYIDEEGRELHAFHIHDGMGMALAKAQGLLLAAISGRPSFGVKARLSQLGVAEIHLGISDKLAKLKQILHKHGLAAEQCCYVGDDINDVEIMSFVGESFAPADAHCSAREAAEHLSRAKGGQGVLREIIDLWLQVNTGIG